MKSYRVSFREVLIATLAGMMLMLLPPLGWNIDFPDQFWLKQVIFGLMLTMIYIINARYIAHTILKPKGLIKYILLVIALTLIVLVTMQVVEHALNLPELMHKAIRPNRPYVRRDWFRFDFSGMLIIIITFGISTIVSLVKKNQDDAMERQELEKQRIANELSFLKAQINPHFFFNTLNSIYALTDIDIEDAKSAIHTLSSMMRHVLYESQKNVTTVKKEIDFIENYIHLMKLRLSSKVKIIFEKPDQDANELIAPMLLLPFIENAFKHGISTQHSSEIKIAIHLKGTKLNLLVENDIFHDHTKSLDESGIGMANTKRRLDLIYHDKFQMENHIVADRYIASLTLDLQ